MNTSSGSVWRWMSLFGVLLVLLVSCGSQPLSADAVQRQFIAAIRANDQSAMQRLIAPDARYTVGSIPTNIYAHTVDAHYSLAYKPTGPFRRVEVEPVKAAGAAMVGKSVWHYEAAVECYDTTLAHMPDGWQVISISSNHQHCP